MEYATNGPWRYYYDDDAKSDGYNRDNEME